MRERLCSHGRVDGRCRHRHHADRPLGRDRGHVWIRSQLRDRQARRAALAARNWHGYIELRNINSWYVRLAEEPRTPTARVVLDVTDRNGNPDEHGAHNMRQTIIGDKMLARVPTPEEHDFLAALRKERTYGKGGGYTVP